MVYIYGIYGNKDKTLAFEYKTEITKQLREKEIN